MTVGVQVCVSMLSYGNTYIIVYASADMCIVLPGPW